MKKNYTPIHTENENLDSNKPFNKTENKSQNLGMNFVAI